MCQMQPAKLSGGAQGSLKGQEVWSGVLHVDALNGGHAGCFTVCPGCVAVLLALQTASLWSCLLAKLAVHLVQVCDAHRRLQQIQLTELLMDSAPVCEFDMVQPPGGEAAG